jgi:hypothetical protein
VYDSGSFIGLLLIVLVYEHKHTTEEAEDERVRVPPSPIQMIHPLPDGLDFKDEGDGERLNEEEREK